MFTPVLYKDTVCSHPRRLFQKGREKEKFQRGANYNNYRHDNSFWLTKALFKGPISTAHIGNCYLCFLMMAEKISNLISNVLFFPSSHGPTTQPDK